MSTEIELIGSARTRSVEHNIVPVNGKQLVTSPAGVAVAFQCSYDVRLSLTSEEFDVQDVSVTGVQTAVGNLESGFKLTAGQSGIGNVLGSDIIINTEWESPLTNISPHYESCEVVQGTTTVSVLKSGCLAEVVNAGNLVGNFEMVQFSYTTFLVHGESVLKQVIKCNVKLCTGNNNCATSANCPADSVDADYGYYKH